MSSRRPPTLAARRRTTSTPEIEALDAIDLWLERHRNSNRLEPFVSGRKSGHVHLYRRTPSDPWAEVGTYATVIDFGLAQAIIPQEARMTATTLDQARRMIEVTDRARRTHQLRHVERDKAGVVFDGVELPDTDAFYVVRKRLTIPKGPGEKRETEWVVVFAATAQGDAVAWIDGDLPAEDEEAASA